MSVSGSENFVKELVKRKEGEGREGKEGKGREGGNESKTTEYGRRKKTRQDKPRGFWGRQRTARTNGSKALERPERQAGWLDGRPDG